MSRDPMDPRSPRPRPSSSSRVARRAAAAPPTARPLPRAGLTQAQADAARTTPLSDEELRLAGLADSMPPHFIAGYDPATMTPPPPPSRRRVVDERPLPAATAAAYRPPTPTDYAFEDGDDDRDDDEDEPEEEEMLAVGEDDDPDDRDDEDDEEPAEPWDDGEFVPPPPTAMPVQYTAWLDLGDLEDRAMARTYRGWKIKCRKDYSLDFLAAAEALQDAAREAKRLQREGGRGGKVRAEVRTSHLRMVLADVLVAWNYVDERGYPLAPPPEGLGQVRGDLLAATLNRAIQEVVPAKKSLRASTTRSRPR